MTSSDPLIRMVNQIAANLAAQGEAAAIEQTAEHLRRYWDPRMKAQIRTIDAQLLSPIARAAVERLAGK